ncbi:hypothetical protein [Treponema sp. R8-4-B8]
MVRRAYTTTISDIKTSLIAAVYGQPLRLAARLPYIPPSAERRKPPLGIIC